MNVAASDFPSIAEIVAEPARLASATPPLTVAIAWSDEVHVMVAIERRLIARAPRR